jgi:hypothetical protein
MTTYRLGTLCTTEGCQQLPDVDLEGIGPVCHTHRSARMRADAVRALRRSDQGDCPDSAMAAEPIALSGHNPRSRACGRVALLRNRATPDRGAFARLFCKSRQCPDCGPRRGQRLYVQFSDLLGGWWDTHPDPVLYATQIAPKAWASLARKLRRAEAAYVRIPVTDGDDLVLVAGEGGIGRAIRTREQLEAVLETALTWTPSSVFDKRRPSHRGFQPEQAEQTTEKPQVKAGVGVDKSTGEPSGWELLGFAGRGITLDMAVRAAQQLDLQPQPIGPRELAHDWAEAYTLRLPPEGTPELEVLCRKLRLRAPGQAEDVTRRSRLAA